VVRVWLVEGVRVSLVEGVRRLVCRVVLMFIIQFSMLILACTLHRLEMLIATQLPSHMKSLMEMTSAILG